MAVFAVLAEQSNPELKDKLAELFPTELYEISPSQWLIATDSVADVIADQLGVREGTFGRVLIVQSAGLAGWHNKALWEWNGQKTKGSI